MSKISSSRVVVALMAMAVFALSLVAALASPRPARAADYTTPVTAAFWYDQSFRHSADHAHPVLASNYSDTNPTQIAAEIDLARDDGIQAFIASWWGQGQHNEQAAFPVLYGAAAPRHFGVVPYYEKEGYSDPSVAEIQADLTYLAAYANANPGAALRIGGKLVVFVYNATNRGCADVTKWKQATHGFTDFYVNMKVFGGYTDCADQPSSWHQYGPAVAEDRQGPYSFSISPGFWKYDEVTPRLPRDPARWALNVAHFKAAAVAWKLITTWDEWGEGSAVEPSGSWQSPSGLGIYGDELRRQLVDGAPAPSPSPSSSGSPTPSPTGTPTPSPTTTSPSPSPSPTSTSPSPTPSPTSTGGMPSPDHIVIVVFENHDRSAIVNSSSAPWLNAARLGGADLTASAAITHPSLPNYLALFSGSTQGVTDDGCNYSFTTPNLANQLISNGRTWGSIAEGVPLGNTSCTVGGNAKKHEPWLYWPSVPLSTELPMTALDGNFDTLPNVVQVTPNLCNDMHDCSIGTGDAWAAAHLQAYLTWATTHNSMLIVTFDEGSSTQNIFTFVAGAHVRQGSYGESCNHYRVLRTVEALEGLGGIAFAGLTTPITDIWS
jgi:phosphatidylinositol-3-phosphatase